MTSRRREMKRGELWRSRVERRLVRRGKVRHIVGLKPYEEIRIRRKS